MRLSVSQLACLLVVAVTGAVNAVALRGQAPGVPGYAGGYAPDSYVVGYPPVATSMPIPGATYSSGYATSSPTYINQSVSAPLSTNGSYQAQRPAYFDNPSVYTGMPVTGYQAGVQSYNASLAASLRGNAAPQAFVETYPTTYYSSAYDGSIPGQPLTVTSPTGLPATSIPVTSGVPLYAPEPPSKGCCLSRFCNKLFGTSYSTSYYRAPITYYRPVTSADPMTGAAVVVQQPCTSYVQQVQRTPYNTLQFGQQPSAPGPASCPTSCPTTQPDCGPTSYGYGQAASPAGSYGQFGTIGQVGAIGGGGEVTSIPSTATMSPPAIQPSFSPSQPGVYPNTAPLTGSPTIAPPPSGDMAPVGQPRLELGPPPSIPQGESAQPPSQASPSHWQLQSPEDSTALIRPKSSEPRSNGSSDNTPSSPAQRIIDSENFTRAEPIEAPSDYVAPYRPHSFQTPRTTPVKLQDFGAPSRPDSNRAYESSDLTSVSTRMPSATSISGGPSQASFARQPMQKPRDTTWTSVRP